ncbi:MAG TPA: hypothetical protein PLG75_04820 [Methanoculleus sp.]|nr:hypothetical protein [Methanoculleus sp.]
MAFGIWFQESAFVVVTGVRSGETIAFTNHGGMNMDRVSEIRCWIGGTAPGDENSTLDTRAGAFEVRVVPDACCGRGEVCRE